jgi:THAP domain-containing protein 4
LADPRTIHPDLAALAPLLGRWSGTGVARFPTIATHDYREELIFTPDPERPLIHFEQRAHQAPAGSDGWTASHWESGFLRPIEPGVVELTNAQDSGRLEIQRLSVTGQPGGLVLDGTAVGLFNDPRMVSARRRFEVRGDQLTYQVIMATTMVAAPAVHLEARLRRAAPE